MHDVAEEGRRLVVEVVACGHHRVAEVGRQLVEVVALYGAAGRTGLAIPLLGQVGNLEARRERPLELRSTGGVIAPALMGWLIDTGSL